MIALAATPATPPLDKPPITVRRTEHGRLYAIAMGAMLRLPRAAGALLDELARCEVREDAQVGDDVAGLSSVVTYRDNGRGPGWVGRIRLVHPDDEDLANDKISVLSTLGAALLGLKPGQSILWNDRRGASAVLRVVEVQPALA